MKPLKFVLRIAVVSLFFCSSIYAADEVRLNGDDSKYFDGFYAGAQIGVDRMNANVNNNSQHDSSFNYEALAGYRHQFDNDWVIGVEAALGGRNGDIQNQELVIGFSNIWHASALLGKTFGTDKNNLVYGKLGVGGIEADLKVNGVTYGQQSFEGPVSTLGYERTLSDRLNFRMEVSYSSYDRGLDQWQPKLGILVKF